MVQAVHSFQTVVDFKHKPDEWHLRFRIMDELCLQVQTLRKYYQKNKDTENCDEEFLEQLIETELSVVDELGQIVMLELNAGLGSDKGRKIVRATSDALGLTPVSRGDQTFIYAILDLIQHHVRSIENAKVNDGIVKVVLQVVLKSPSSYLRCKAFEVLATMRTKRDISPDDEVCHMLATWPVEIQTKASNQWTMIKRRVEDLELKLKVLRGEAPKEQSSKTPAPIIRTPVIQVRCRTTLTKGRQMTRVQLTSKIWTRC